MYCIIVLCRENKRVLKTQICVIHLAQFNVKTQICVTRPQCVNLRSTVKDKLERM